MVSLDSDQTELLKSLESEAKRLERAEQEYESAASQQKRWARDIRKRKDAILDRIHSLRQGQLSFDEYCTGAG